MVSCNALLASRHKCEDQDYHLQYLMYMLFKDSLEVLLAFCWLLYLLLPGKMLLFCLPKVKSAFTYFHPLKIINFKGEASWL